MIFIWRHYTRSFEPAKQDSATRKRRFRAGQKSSTEATINLLSPRLSKPLIPRKIINSLATFERFISTLREKREIVIQLDAEILDVTLEDIKEIEKADVYREKIIITIEQAVSDIKANHVANDRPGDRIRPSNVSVAKC